MAKRSDVSFPLFAGALALILTAGAFALPVLPQAQSYHHFADQAASWGVPHAADVLSNLAFLLVGLYGVFRRPRYSLGADILLGLVTFWVGIFLVAAGSAYYHWAPSDATLVWDRIPMSIAFMGVSFSLIVAQSRLKAYVLPYVGLELLGVAATLYAHFWDDLRFYLMCQLFPLLLALSAAVRLRSLPISRDLLWAFVAYISAKLFEHYDRAVYELTSEVVSGHTIKHLLAALGAFFVLRFFLYLKPSEARELEARELEARELEARELEARERERA